MRLPLFFALALFILLGIVFGRVTAPTAANATATDARITDVVAQLRITNAKLQNVYVQLQQLNAETGTKTDLASTVQEKLDAICRAVATRTSSCDF